MRGRPRRNSRSSRASVPRVTDARVDRGQSVVGVPTITLRRFGAAHFSGESMRKRILGLAVAAALAAGCASTADMSALKSDVSAARAEAAEAKRIAEEAKTAAAAAQQEASAARAAADAAATEAKTASEKADRIFQRSLHK
jgi:hypothetical protein